MEKEKWRPKFSDEYGPEDIKKLEEEDEEREKLEEELLPEIVKEVEEIIKEEGIDENEVKQIMEELKKANPSWSEKELRERAILIWKEDLIDEIMEERVRERLEGEDEDEEE